MGWKRKGERNKKGGNKNEGNVRELREWMVRKKGNGGMKKGEEEKKSKRSKGIRWKMGCKERIGSERNRTVGKRKNKYTI